MWFIYPFVVKLYLCPLPDASIKTTKKQPVGRFWFAGHNGCLCFFIQFYLLMQLLE